MSELPDNNYEEARRWAAQAADDVRAARHLLGDADLPARVACFLGHLVAEKALKAVLIDCGVPFRKIHDLPDLAAMLPDERRTAFDADALERLNPWVIDGRYADDHVEASQISPRGWSAWPRRHSAPRWRSSGGRHCMWGGARIPNVLH